jgi:2-dehydro-3-deoxygluconokinase
MTRVACIGECMIEMKQAQGGSSGGLFARGYGGDTLNTAVYLARLGVDVDYLTATTP